MPTPSRSSWRSCGDGPHAIAFSRWRGRSMRIKALRTLVAVREREGARFAVAFAQAWHQLADAQDRLAAAQGEQAACRADEARAAQAPHDIGHAGAVAREALTQLGAHLSHHLREWL